MTRQRRPQPAPSWMDGYRHQPSLEAACEALEVRLNEGRRRPFADAIRAPMEADWWVL